MILYRRPAALPAALAETIRAYPLCVLDELRPHRDHAMGIRRFLATVSASRFLRDSCDRQPCRPPSARWREPSPVWINRRKTVDRARDGLRAGTGRRILDACSRTTYRPMCRSPLLSYVVATLAAGRAAGGGPVGFWRANVLGLTGLAIGLAVVCISLAGFGSSAYALEALLDVERVARLRRLLTIGIAFVWPVIALTGCGPPRSPMRLAREPASSPSSPRSRTPCSSR